MLQVTQKGGKRPPEAPARKMPAPSRKK